VHFNCKYIKLEHCDHKCTQQVFARKMSLFSSEQRILSLRLSLAHSSLYRHKLAAAKSVMAPAPPNNLSNQTQSEMYKHTMHHTRNHNNAASAWAECMHLGQENYRLVRVEWQRSRPKIEDALRLIKSQ
jgi:hypothetical protein